MNTNTAAKVSLRRVLPGFYAANIAKGHTLHSFEVIDQGGLWTIKNGAGETWMVESLKAARAFIAAEVA